MVEFARYFMQAEHGMSMSDILMRLLIAAVLGIAIGTERQWRGHPAGIQTSSLVCFGAALYSLITPALGAANDYRIVASIVTGVGFLAGGVILKEGLSVTGLNTAATIWSTAAVGALAGVGLWREAALAAFAIIALNLFFFPFTKWIDARVKSRQE